MKKSKKLIASMTAYAVVAALVVPAASAASVNFGDISNSYAKDAIQKLADKGILNGKADGVFDPAGNVTRAEFAKILVLSAGLDVSAAPAKATFSDVATGDWSYKYVEAAVKAKLINGVGNGQFGPNAQLSRQDMAVMFVRALGADVTGKGASLTFADKDSIASYAKDAVAYAVELGLINGVGGNNFNPQGNASREAIAKVANLFLDKVQAPAADLKIVATKTNVAIGEKAQFSVTATNSPVVWAVDANGVIDQNGNFVGTAAGTATVSATVNGQTVKQVVSVYGAAAAVKFSTPTDLVANGKSTEDVTVTVVDANGNAVSNYTGAVKVYYKAAPNASAILNGTATVTGITPAAGMYVNVNNGVGKVTLQASAIAGFTDTLQAQVLKSDGTVDANFAVASATVNSVAQVATSIKLDTDKNVAVNTQTASTIKAQVNDQTGNPMVDGKIRNVTFQISGPASFDTATDVTSKTVATNSSDLATVSVYSKQAQAGTINVTATGEGLTAATGSIAAVIAGTVSALDLSKNADSFTAGATTTNGVIVTVNNLDSAGNTVGKATGTVNVKLSQALGTSGDIIINGSNDGGDKQSWTGVILANGTFEIRGVKAGTYTATVTQGSLSKDVTFTVNASSADHVAQGTNQDSIQFVPSSNPASTLSVKLQDVNNNDVKAGKQVAFYLDADNTVATLNGTLHALLGSPVKVTTDANGVASVNFVGEKYSGKSYTVNAVMLDNTGAPTGAIVSYTVKTVEAAAASVTASAVGGQNTYQVGNPAVGVNVAVKDAQGNALAGQTQNLTLKVSDATATLAGTGVALVPGTTDTYSLSTDAIGAGSFTFTGGTAGTVTVAVTDNSASPALSTSIPFRVIAATTADHFNFYDANGNKVTSTATLKTTANTPVALTLKAVDAKGNLVNAGMDYVLTLGDTASGHFRLSANGDNIVAPNSVKFAAGQSAITVYYVNAADQSAVSFTAAKASAAVTSGSLTAVSVVGTGTNFTSGTSVVVVDAATGATVAGATTYTDATHVSWAATAPATMVATHNYTVTITTGSEVFTSTINQ